MIHGKASSKPGISEIAKDSRGIAHEPQRGGWGYSAPYELLAARANVLTYVGLWPMTIKLNPS